ncbi:MAG: UDP-N-acetylglucosamine 2-epimerase (non-hydrolyzing) [Firmicutes bacterium]|nr:UDP-N-acetylglucosamine 2-epimerase (non-hydrolyzing) [Bacillota bacterium]
MTKIKLLSVFGTRPEAIKMAPLILELESREEFASRVAVTGQHREMLQQVLKEFNLTPDYDLDIMRESQTLFDTTTGVLRGLENVLAQEKPHMLLVHGDTTTTFASALAAFYRQIPVGHVEAGLRSFSRYLPFPEEINRCLTTVLADLHFAPTETSRENLLQEGIDPQKIIVTGNTAIDALLMTVKKDHVFTDPSLQELDLSQKRVIVVEAHRRENWGAPLTEICTALGSLVRRRQDIRVIFPVHPNPIVRKTVYKELGGEVRVHLVPPLNYKDFVNLMARAYLLVTDSGGIQEEAPSLGKPVLVLREVTERPEAVAAGTVKVIGTAAKAVEAALNELLTDTEAYKNMARAVNPYGDGRAACRIVDGLCSYFKLTREKSGEFGEFGDFE